MVRGLTLPLRGGEALGGGGDCGFLEGIWELLQLSFGQLLPPAVWTHGGQNIKLSKDAGIIKTPSS